MSNNNNQTQIRISREDMEKLQKNAEKSAPKKPIITKEKVSPGKIVLRVLFAMICAAYYGLIFFGHFFMDKEGMFLSSLDPFSGAENPNNIIRIISLCILTLSISAVLRFFIGRLVKNKKVTKKIGIAFIELLGNLVKYS